MPHGNTIVAIANPEFIIDNDSQNIYHNLIILAKNIKVYNNFAPSFKKIPQYDEGKKLQLVFVA